MSNNTVTHLCKIINIFSQFSATYVYILTSISGNKNYNYWIAQKSHIKINAKKLCMNGIMAPAMSLHHVWFRTHKAL